MSSSADKPIVMTLSREEMKSRALAFARDWAGPQREEAEAKTFLDAFFAVFGRDRRAVDAHFEHRVEREARGEGRIDLLWPGKLVVEMKSTGRDLAEAYAQALDYVQDLDPEERPRWLLVSDFARFTLYDLGEEIHEDLRGLASGKRVPELAAAFRLEELPDKLRHFAFIRDEEQALFQTQPEVNLKAVKLLARFHDALKAAGFGGHDLERLLVRVLFCLFAEDTDIFPWNSFTRVVERSLKDGSDLGLRLAKLFDTLNWPAATRQKPLPAEFALFPYVNGGLFAERLGIADFTETNRAALLACCRFDWSRISPSIFGSLFQGVMEPAERRQLGAHYTSEENIRRVIDPLFLDALKAEFQKLRAEFGTRTAAASRPSEVSPIKKRKDRADIKTPLKEFHDKLSTLRFLDPACGCGNFLVVAYRELRALELAVLREIYGGQLALGLDIGDIVRVNVDQFYGIEIEEFPALIAETALWLTDHQVNLAVSKAFGRHYARIPLVKSPTIVIGNSLRMHWDKVLMPENCSYVLGNPPFIGQTFQNAEQKADQQQVLADIEARGVLDYVCNWYVQAARYVRGTDIRCAFVSTNSITQGEQVGILWHYLFGQFRLKIHFAHRTFSWTNEASGKAAVHVVIIGFGATDVPRKIIFDYDANGKQTVSSGTANISPYLVAGSDSVIGNRTIPISAVPKMSWGNKPTDGGHFILSPEERAALLEQEPQAAPLIRPYMGGGDFINGVQRYCLWLKDADPALLRRCPAVMARVNSVRAFRAESKAESTRRYADKPTLFRQIAQPPSEYLAVPEVSSENRRYIPMAYVSSDVICSNTVQFVPNATKFHFGVLTSAMHIAWVGQVCGRLKSDYRYSNTLVYNNYPWPEPDAKQRAAIETAAQAVLDARAPHLARGASLADLYDPLAMPAELLKAHQNLDRAVDKSYRPAVFTSDRERVEFLFARYEKITSPLAPAAPKPRRPRQPKASTPAGYTQADLDSAHIYAKEDPTAPG